MKPSAYIWKDGYIAPLAKSSLASFHQGLNYGACVYDGIRCYNTKRGPAMFRVDPHIDRFYYSAQTLGMSLHFTRAQMRKAICNVIRANKLRSGYVRPMAFYSESKMGINVLGSKITVLIFAWKWNDNPVTQNISLKIVRLRRLDPRTVDLRAKISGYYANGLLGFLEAKKSGCDLPLFLDTDGCIAESAISNIFIVKKGVLITPKTGAILPGITRDSVLVIAKHLAIPTRQSRLKPDDLKNADEIFLTGTGIQLQKVSSIKNNFNAKETQTPLTDRIRAAYERIAHGEDASHRHWLLRV